jgi:hypothetical protein
VTNKAICWTALNAFALTMLPGLLARFQDAIYDTKMLDKPKWLIFGLRIRKPLGLLALWFLGIHIFMSLLMFNQKYYGKFFIDPKASSSKLNAIGESSFFFGILGAGFYFILGVCSLPSVGAQMTSRSWQVSESSVLNQTKAPPPSFQQSLLLSDHSLSSFFETFQFAYGPLVWTALLFGTTHVLIMGVKGWDDQEKWPGNLPPITLTSALIPMLV